MLLFGIIRKDQLLHSSLIKKRLQRRCFPVKFAKLLRTPFFKNASGDCFCYFLNSNLKTLITIGNATATVSRLFWFLNFFALTLNQGFRTCLQSEKSLAMVTKFIKIHKEIPKATK